MAVAAVDLDNVLSNTDPRVREIIESISGVNLAQDDIISWDYAEALMREGLDTVTAKQVVEEAFHRFHEKECAGLQALEGAVEGVRKLRVVGFEVAIVTGRHRTAACEENTRRWLRAHSIPDSWLLFESEKARVCGAWGLLVDDAPHHAKEVAAMGVPVYLLDYPWNRGVEGPLITRCFHWRDLLEALLA